MKGDGSFGGENVSRQRIVEEEAVEGGDGAVGGREYRPTPMGMRKLMLPTGKGIISVFHPQSVRVFIFTSEA